MNMNIFWAVYVFAFAVALFITAYALGWRSMHKKGRCTEKTTGEVIRYSALQYNGISLPIVRYVVNGTEYKVVGPHFKGSVTTNFSAPWNNPVAEQKTNLNTREDLPDVIKIKAKTNSLVSVRTTPITELYPIGSQADVYYDPKKPKIAYVQRYAGSFTLLSFWLPLIIGIICTALGFFFLFGPRL